MKNRNLPHKDDWATFDPCPLHNDLTKWNGLEKNWNKKNFINPPYSKGLKAKFISLTGGE